MGRYFPLPPQYLSILQARDEFELTIMGKDPFPQDPVGIPFCKPDWDQLNDAQCSGLHVLASLGVNVAAVRSTFIMPADYFQFLARSRGIAFLNLSYHFLDGPCRKGAHRAELLQAAAVNVPVLSKSRSIVLCGEASKHRWYGNSLSHAHQVVHPDVRCRISRYPQVAAQWQAWWSSGAIAQRLGISV